MQVSIIDYSAIDKRLFRLEAEFYNSNSLLNSDCYFAEDIIDFVQYGTSKELNEEQKGFPTLRLNEFDSIFIKKPQKYCEKIDLNTFNSLSLKKEDILICRTNGNPKLVGKTAIVPKDAQYAFASYLFRVRPDYSKILPSVLVSFLNSTIGRAEIEKFLMVSNQANFSPAKFKEILIPKFSNNIQILIDKNIWQSYKCHDKSKELYNEAQSILLSELGLTNWQPKHQLTFIKNFSDTQQAERIDAEYYQPKYEEIINAIKNYSDGWDSLDKLVDIKKCIEVGSGEYLDEGVPFVRVSNISPFEITEEKYISEALYGELTPKEKDIPFIKSKNHQPQQGEILFSKDGTPGIAHYLKEPPPKMIPSGGILRLKSKTDKINNEYLTLVLNSVLTQEQVNRDVGGSIILHWRPDQVKQTVVPILSEEKQLEIQQKVTESFNLRKQSRQLLESAKKAVEMAIEQDEKTAIDWLKGKINSIGVGDARGL